MTVDLNQFKQLYNYYKIFPEQEDFVYTYYNNFFTLIHEISKS